MNELTAPKNILSLRLSRCPRKASQAPAGDMWSVVHFPEALTRTGMSVKSWPSHAGHGSRICRRVLLGLTFTVISLPSSGGATYVACPESNPLAGTSGAGLGASSINSLPSAPVKVSVRGLKLKLPPRPIATASSGLAMKFIVPELASFRLGKLRLYDVTIEFGSPSGISSLRH